MEKIFLVLIISLVFFSGCIGGTTETTTTLSQVEQTTLPPAPSKVDIQGFAFNPSTITVKAGATVTWTNKDSAPHTVTSDSGNEIGSQTLPQGGTYSHTFNTPGTFNYHCGIHSSMKGTVIVE